MFEPLALVDVCVLHGLSATNKSCLKELLAYLEENDREEENVKAKLSVGEITYVFRRFVVDFNF